MSKLNKVLLLVQCLIIAFNYKNLSAQEESVAKLPLPVVSIIIDDLNTAKTIQEYLLPEIPDNDIVSIDYRYLPMSSLGGDCLNINKFSNEKLGVFIGDVAGHGVQAAMITSVVNVQSKF